MPGNEVKAFELIPVKWVSVHEQVAKRIASVRFPEQGRLSGCKKVVTWTRKRRSERMGSITERPWEKPGLPMWGRKWLLLSQD